MATCVCGFGIQRKSTLVNSSTFTCIVSKSILYLGLLLGILGGRGRGGGGRAWPPFLVTNGERWARPTRPMRRLDTSRFASVRVRGGWGGWGGGYQQKTSSRLSDLDVSSSSSSSSSSLLTSSTWIQVHRVSLSPGQRLQLKGLFAKIRMDLMWYHTPDLALEYLLLCLKM
jgi:hypothetical protein